jgi:putative transposase
MPKPTLASKGLPRSYLFKIAPELNAGKAFALEAVQTEWQRTLPLAFDWYWAPFLKGGLFPRNPVRSGPNSTFPVTRLVTSQKDLMTIAIQGQAQSWSSNLKNRIAKSVMRCAMLAQRADLRRQLLWINSMRAWLLPYSKQLELLQAQPLKKDSLKSLSKEASRTMRKLVRNYLSRKKLPDPLNLPLQVNQQTSVWSDAQDTTSKWAAHWLRVSTLERNQRISLPVMGNPFSDRRKGVQATTFALFKKDANWYATAVKFHQPQGWPEFKTSVLGIDLGLRTLMSTSEGDLYGQGFLTRLQHFDAQIQRIQKGLQGAGELKLNQCRRYRVVVQRLRGWLKTQVQTHLNRLLDVRRPAKVVVEDLAFAGEPGLLSRRMNRLLRRFGQGTFLTSLNTLSADFGFEVEAVNPAYTSQTCAACGFVHSDNRKGDTFECISCGHRAHADVNAAKNLCRRSEQKAISVYSGPATVWTQSLQEWMQRQSAALTSKGPSGLCRRERAVGGTRVGLKALVRRKGPAAKLSPELRLLLQSRASQPMPGLLTGLTRGMELLQANKLKQHSTR